MSILASYFPDIPKKDLEEIENLYNHPDRAYHNIQHIRFCLAQLLSLDIDLTEEEKSQLGLAILFHDVIYLPKQEDLENIRASCKFAEKKLKEWGYLDKDIEKIKKLILAIDYSKWGCFSKGEQIMRELDLSILAANRADFEQYEENIRKEYSFVLNNVFYPNRAKIMEKFLDILRNGKLFYYLPDEYNKKAKENIEWLLGQYKEKGFI